uniref:MADF domain-containing protein n=1 Tax=Caenorhabditis tropicalis TaxID=1561998 RepID=A0A1I7UGW9_9PELO
MIGTIKGEKTEDDRPATPLPPAIHQISLRDYSRYRIPNPEVAKNLKIKKVVLGVMAKYPELWENHNGEEYMKKWREVGLEVYARTGVVVDVPTLRRMFGTAKGAMKQRLKAFLHRQESHNTLPRPGRAFVDWDLYPHFKWSIEHLAKSNPKWWQLVAVNEDDEDCIFEGAVDPGLVIDEEVPEAGYYEEIVEEAQEEEIPPEPWDKLHEDRDFSPEELLEIIRESTIALFQRNPHHAREIQETLCTVFTKIREADSIDDTHKLFGDWIREEEIRERIFGTRR